MTTNILHQFSRGGLSFNNRVFMAPMTRSRAPLQIPTALMQEYYSQRASAGLIFSEATQISSQGVGYIETPGIYTAAESAKLAGFDGVEIHAANGYLPAQFLEDGANQRNDIYGGSLENRARFILEITDAAISIWGSERVSVRLSPRNPYNGMSDSNPTETYLYLIEQLEQRKLGILHFMESAQLPDGVEALAPEVSKIFSGLLVLNTGYDKKSAEAVIADGKGTIYVPPQRINRPDGFGGTANNIAILKLPRKLTPIDDKGKAIEKPILYDGNYELYNTVTFVGYGAWGVGLDISGSYGPASGPRRLWGQNKINEIFEKDYAIGTKYEPLGRTDSWTRVGMGDSGSAWWQVHNGIPTIIATTNGGSNYVSTGARVSKYIDWIKSVYPNVELYSHYSLLNGYQYYQYQHIPGHNDLHLDNVSRADCAYQCSQAEWCQSFDYYNNSNQCDLSKSVADGVKIKLANHPNWDHYQVKPKVPALDRFAYRQYQHIPGQNHLSFSDITREECAIECINTGWCQSFDYHNNTNKCDLSKAKAGVDGIVLASSPDYDYYELFKPVNEDHQANINLF